jgi:superfamily II DNA or RNA helicase
VRVGCTVVSSRGVARLASADLRSAELRGFSPKSHHPSTDPDKYEVLICTDADGVGVNLQDCATVVNYDPPGGVDVLFQRVGRILRMTTVPDLDVHVYTLLPTILEETTNESRLAQSIRWLFERMTQRHEKSRGLMGSAAFTSSPRVDIALNGDIDALHFVRQDELLTEVGDLGAASFLTHSATLEKHRAQASQLPSYLLSAKL